MVGCNLGLYKQRIQVDRGTLGTVDVAHRDPGEDPQKRPSASKVPKCSTHVGFALRL